MSERIESLVQRLKTSRAKLIERLGKIGNRSEEQVYSEGAQWTLRQLAIHLMLADKGHLAMVKGIATGNEVIPPDYDLERFNARSVQKNADVTVDQVIMSLQHTHQEMLDWLHSADEHVLDKEGLHASLSIMSIERIFKVVAWHDGHHGDDIEKHLEG